MGLGKIARGAGKVGLALEGLGYVWQAGSALYRMIRGKRLGEAPQDAALRDETPPLP